MAQRRRAHAARSMLARTVADLDPAVFAFVMATGIVSTGLASVGAAAPSAVLLGLAAAGYLLLLAATVARLTRARARLLADLTGPRAFAALTFVAGSNVLAARFAVAGWGALAAALLGVGVLAWLVLDYGVVLALVTAGEDRWLCFGQLDGTWFMWVVSTESVAVAAGMVARLFPTAHLGLLASLCWSVGLMLYPLVATLAAARLLLRPVTPAELTPPYWMFMGAAAITVLGGATLLGLPGAGGLLPAEVVAGFALVLWALCCWLVPLLAAASVWRRLRLGASGYRTALWAVAFPLGMFGLAGHQLGRARRLDWLAAVGDVGVGVAATVWAAVFLSMLVAAFKVIRQVYES